MGIYAEIEACEKQQANDGERQGFHYEKRIYIDSKICCLNIGFDALTATLLTRWSFLSTIVAHTETISVLYLYWQILQIVGLNRTECQWKMIIQQRPDASTGKTRWPHSEGSL
jgi:hypothetical protein